MAGVITRIKRPAAMRFPASRFSKYGKFQNFFKHGGPESVYASAHAHIGAPAAVP